MGTNLDSLAAAYLRYEAKDKESVRAFDKVGELLRDDPEQAWEFTLRAIARCDGEAQLAFVAAGPLEELLNKHGPRFIDRVEDEARRNAKFLLALCGCWMNDSDVVFPRWLKIMENYGFTTGRRKAL